ncbi:MAG: exo-alpha-sialidase [Pirellulales bacterium]|nr:exo-alpha-sialidase [Pirellulales bacterium]
MKKSLSLMAAVLFSIALRGGVWVGNAWGADTKADAGKKLDYEAVDYQRRTIYHSPETPGFTCWVYPWIMPDNSIMVCFYQATGPKEGRPRAPLAVQKKLSWPALADPRRDMTGLNSSTVYLRSTDGGTNWNKVSEVPFRGVINSLVHGGVALPDGTLLRSLYGAYLPYDAEVPRTGLVQRSTDDGKTWGKMECYLPADKFLAYPINLHLLRDGRPIFLGGISRGPADRPWSEFGETMEPLLMVSDDSGKTWGKPIQVIPEANRKGWSCEECDAVELPNGDLFWVFRRCVPQDADKPMHKRAHTHWQGVMEKCGNSWKPKWVGPSPFPNLGLPSLVATREGPILYVNGNHLTADEGKTWHKVKNLPAPAYYPKGLQLADGRILVFSHLGSDDPYGVVDQKILLDTYRLKAK